VLKILNLILLKNNLPTSRKFSIMLRFRDKGNGEGAVAPPCHHVVIDQATEKIKLDIND